MDCRFIIFVAFIVRCQSVSLRRQLEHITRAKLESEGLQGLNGPRPSRRSFYQYDPRELSTILGAPGEPSHLPEAEPILPGHTLLRPVLGMLKSSVKFPHKDWEEGSGVYGNIENLGETYGRNERILYSGFRRSPTDYLMIVPSSNAHADKPKFDVVSLVLDLDNKMLAEKKIRNAYDNMKTFGNQNLGAFFTSSLNKKGPLTNKLEEPSYYLQVPRTRNAIQETNEFKLPRYKKPILRLKPDNLEEIKVILEASTEPSSYNENDPRMKKSKQQLFYETQNAFNHIKVSQDAPEFSEFVPKPTESENIRNWWFYTADDFQPFDVNDI